MDKGGMKLLREEKLACIVALEKHKKIGEWGKSALAKLLQDMKLKPLAPIS